MNGHGWTVDSDQQSSPILEGPSGFRISDCSAHWSGWEDEDFEALVRCVRDAGTLAEARQLAARIREHEYDDDDTDTLCALLDLLTGDTVTLTRPGRLHRDDDGAVSLDLSDSETIEATVIDPKDHQ